MFLALGRVIQAGLAPRALGVCCDNLWGRSEKNTQAGFAWRQLTMAQQAMPWQSKLVFTRGGRRERGERRGVSHLTSVLGQTMRSTAAQTKRPSCSGRWFRSRARGSHARGGPTGRPALTDQPRVKARVTGAPDRDDCAQTVVSPATGAGPLLLGVLICQRPAPSTTAVPMRRVVMPEAPK